MAVTTGGITVAVGALIVGALGVAGVATLRDDSNDNTSKASECQPRSEAKAKAAERAFVARYVEPDPEARWIGGFGITSGEAGSVLVRDAREAGFRASRPLPKTAGQGWVLVVNYDPDADDLPSLPTCVEDTPVLYIGSGQFSLD